MCIKPVKTFKELFICTFKKLRFVFGNNTFAIFNMCHRKINIYNLLCEGREGVAGEFS